MMIAGNIHNTHTAEPVQQKTTSSAQRSHTNLRHLMTVAAVAGLSMLGRSGVMAQAPENNRSLRQPNHRPESQLRDLAPLDTTQKPPLTAEDIAATRASLGTPVELVGFDTFRGVMTAAQLYTAYESAVSVSEVIGRPLIEILSDPTFKQAVSGIVGDASAAIFTDALIQKAAAAGSGIAKGILMDKDVQAAVGTVVGLAAGEVLTDANIQKVAAAGSDIAKGILLNTDVQAAVGKMVGVAAGEIITDGNIQKVATAGSNITKAILTDTQVQAAVGSMVGIATGQILTDANIQKVKTAGSDIAKGILMDKDVQAAVGTVVGIAAGEILTDGNIQKVKTATSDVAKGLLTDKGVQEALQGLVGSVIDSATGLRGARQCPPFGC